MNRDPGLGQPLFVGASGITKRLDALRRHHPLTGQRLLDIGCGNGAYTEVLAAGFEEVVGVDVVAEHLLDFERRLRGSALRSRITLLPMAAERLDVPDAHFDVVSMIEVLEHVRNVDLAVSEIVRVLQPGGALLISVPNRYFPFETHLVKLGRRQLAGKFVPGLTYVPPLHRRVADARVYTPRTLRRTLLRHGMTERGMEWVMPPFDGWRAGRRFVRPMTDRLERSPLKVMGVSILAVFTKTAT